jgi:hypothetical protein
MKQLGQAHRPNDLQLLAFRAELGLNTFDDWMREAMDRHYELTMLPGVCEAVARRDWDAIDIIAERWDY